MTDIIILQCDWSTDLLLAPWLLVKTQAFRYLELYRCTNSIWLALHFFVGIIANVSWSKSFCDSFLMKLFNCTFKSLSQNACWVEFRISPTRVIAPRSKSSSREWYSSANDIPKRPLSSVHTTMGCRAATRCCTGCFRRSDTEVANLFEVKHTSTGILLAEKLHTISTRQIYSMTWAKYWWFYV